MVSHDQTTSHSVIVPVDGVFHTIDSPFCWGDRTCPCHEDQARIAQVAEAVNDGLLTPDEATRLVAGRQL